MTRTLLILISGLLLSTNINAASALKFINPWIPEAPPGASVMAGYMEIQNSSDKQIDIMSISSSSFKSIEMHQSREVDGFAKMQPQKKLSIPAKGKLILTSGSYHLMLIKPTQWLKHGDTATLYFTLSDNQQQTVVLNIQKNKTRAMKCAAGKCGGM